MLTSATLSADAENFKFVIEPEVEQWKIYSIDTERKLY